MSTQRLGHVSSQGGLIIHCCGEGVVLQVIVKLSRIVSDVEDTLREGATG